MHSFTWRCQALRHHDIWLHKQSKHIIKLRIGISDSEREKNDTVDRTPNKWRVQRMVVHARCHKTAMTLPVQSAFFICLFVPFIKSCWESPHISLCFICLFSPIKIFMRHQMSDTLWVRFFKFIISIYVMVFIQLFFLSVSIPGDSDLLFVQCIVWKTWFDITSFDRTSLRLNEQ